MKKEIKIIVLGIIIAILIPSILSILIHLPKFSFVAGNEDSWISFWGAYIGALVTGIISFLILRKTINSNKEEFDKEHSLMRNREIIADIANRLPNINYARVGFIKAAFEDRKSDYTLEKEIINEMLNKVTIEYDQFYLRYNDLYPNFISTYYEEVTHFKEVLFKIYNGLSAIPEYNGHNEQEISFYIQKVVEIINSTASEENTKRSNKLWTEAKKIIKSCKDQGAEL